MFTYFIKFKTEVSMYMSNIHQNDTYVVRILVTASPKTGLIAHDRKLNFLAQTQRYINALSVSTSKMRQH